MQTREVWGDEHTLDKWRGTWACRSRGWGYSSAAFESAVWTSNLYLALALTVSTSHHSAERRDIRAGTPARSTARLRQGQAATAVLSCVNAKAEIVVLTGTDTTLPSGLDLESDLVLSIWSVIVGLILKRIWCMSTEMEARVLDASKAGGCRRGEGGTLCQTGSKRRNPKSIYGSRYSIGMLEEVVN